MKLYITYGSNLNKAQMAKRCPKAIPAGSGILKDWELLYRGKESGFYATIQPKKGSVVPVGLWEISPEDEKALDIYEVYPDLYYKETLSVTLTDGTEKNAMVYIMCEDARDGRPTAEYIQSIRNGYADFGLDIRIFEASLDQIK